MALPEPIVVDVSAFAADVLTVDALARLQLAAQRRGARILLRNASEELRRLIAFCALGDVLRVEPGR
jgi:hypothetical protein